MVYVYRPPPLATIPSNSSSDNYNKLLPTDYGSVRCSHLTERTLTVDENVIANIMSIDHATPVVETTEHPHHFKASKTSSKDKKTHYKTDTYRETVTTSARHEDSYTETG